MKASPPSILPASRLAAFVRSPFGWAAAQPVYDTPLATLLGRVYFPLSRLWAAAGIAGDDPDAFRAALALDPACPVPMSALADVRAADLRRCEAEAAWAELAFGTVRPPEDALVGAELMRRAASRAWMGRRVGFMPMLLRRRVAAAGWETPDPIAAADGLAAMTADPGGLYAAPDRTLSIRQSWPVPGLGVRVSWLRFPSPGRWTGDEAWARITEPEDVPSGAPTFIFCHGLAIEAEMLRDPFDEAAVVRGLGVRVVRPEAPWHGRRRQPGRWGGEPFVARAPLGAIELFQSSLSEIAGLTAWCRDRYGGPVAIGGISMGALTTQLAAIHATGWPAAMRPDAVLLMATSDSAREVATTGALARALGLDRVLAAAGWDGAALDRVSPLLDPVGAPALDPDRIVMVLGQADRVTPYAGGLRLADRWRVPEQNRILWRQGHFSLSVALMRDLAPFARLLSRLAA